MRDLIRSLGVFVTETKTRAGILAGGALAIIAGGVLDYFGKELSGWLAQSLGVLAVLAGSFLAFHALRTKYEIGFVDHRLEVIAETPGRYSASAAGRPRSFLVRSRDSGEIYSRLAAIESARRDGTRLEFKARETIPGSVKVTYSQPVYSAYGDARNPDDERQSLTIKRERQSVTLTTLEYVKKGWSISVICTAPAPVTVCRLEVVKPPPPVDPPSTTAPAQPPPP